jgi:hypothetical protein
MDKGKILYERPLPGGGYVHVQETDGTDTGTHRVAVAVERRGDPSRRDGHQPPVIATAEGRSLSALVRRLLGIAADNVEVAKGLLRRSGGRARF